VFPEIPQDLSVLTDEDLSSLLDELVANFNEAAAAAQSEEDVAALASAAESIEAIRAESARREAAAEERAATLAELVARVNGGEGGDGEQQEGEGEEEQEEEQEEQPQQQAIAAAARPPARPGIRQMAQLRPRERAPQPPPATGVRILAAPDLGRYHTGQELSLRDVAQAFIDRTERLGRSSGVEGDVVPIATVEAHDDRRFLREQASPGDNMAIVASALDAWRHRHEDQALVAAGGLCAPPAPYYDLFEETDNDDRPVRDALPSFNADRGGITLIAPPTLAGLAGSVSLITADADAAGGVGAEKACLHVVCGAPRTYNVSAIARCLEFGNFGARTFPEQVEGWLGLAAAAHARRAETILLDAIAANSTGVTAAQVLGASREVFAVAGQVAAAYRSRHRLRAGAPLDALYPSWVADLIRADQARGRDDAEVMSNAEIEAEFRNLGINVAWYLDGKTGGGQVFGAQAAGAALTFPPSMIWYIYAPGTFLFLDGGTLDFGTVRDSTLNTRNDYRVMVETFEALAYLGLESLEVTQAVCANGEMGARRAGGAALVCPV